MKPPIGLLLCAFLLTIPSAWPDSAPVVCKGIEGMDVIPIRNQKVRMVREVVDIDCAWAEYSVRVDFWFKNVSDQRQEVKLGFPVDYSGMAAGLDEEEISDTLDASCKSFKVEWNGKPVKFTLAKRQAVKDTDGTTAFYRQWITWTSHFEPHEEIHSKVSYTFPGWSREGERDDDAYVYLKYILKTGAAWQGAIESSIVRIHYGHPLRYCGIPVEWMRVPKPNKLKIYPPGYVLDDKTKTITWKFRNLEPTQDIYFGWGDVPDFKELDEETKIRLDAGSAQPDGAKGNGIH